MWAPVETAGKYRLRKPFRTQLLVEGFFVFPVVKKIKRSRRPLRFPKRQGLFFAFGCAPGEFVMQQAAPLTQPVIEFRQPVDSPPAPNALSRSAVDESARRLLGSSSYLSLRAVHCEHREGALILRGTLPSYFLKQMGAGERRRAAPCVGNP
jgi:hypothetical protein